MISFNKVLQFVRLWTDLHPELKDRLERAAFLVSVVKPTLHPDTYKVRSETSNRKEYVVRINREARTSTCSCPDSKKGNHCKHRLATALYEKTV